MSEPTPLKDIYLPVILIGIVFLVILIFPPLASVVGILAPIPLVFVFLQRGAVVGSVLLVFIYLVLWTLLGATQATLFFAEYAVLSLLMAETIRAGFSFDRCIFFSALSSAFLSTIFLFFLLGEKDSSWIEFFQKQIQAHFQQSLDALKAFGEDPAQIDDMKAFAEKASATFAMAYPAFIAVGALVTAVINYFIVRALWFRFYGKTLFKEEKIIEWMLPEQFIWALIGSGALLFAGESFIGSIGMSCFLLIAVIYFFQGLVIGAHFLIQKNVHAAFWAIILFLIFIQPMLMGLVIGLGVFDIWVDFRKIKKPEPDEAG